MTTGNAGSVGGAEPESLEQQLRRKRVKPIGSADDLACDGLFETDAELEEFLAYTYTYTYTYTARRAEVA